MTVVEVPRTLVQALVDMAIASMDWGSGFLDTEDVGHLRDAAKVLGISPRDVTPAEFRREYKEPLDEDETAQLPGLRRRAEECTRNGVGSTYFDRIIKDFEERLAANGQTEQSG